MTNFDLCERYADDETTPALMRVDTVTRDVGELRSANGRFRFGLLPDSNIVVRDRRKVIWESRSSLTREPPETRPFRLVLKSSGDLVAFDGHKIPFWSSGTAKCGPRPFRLLMQDDGHCVLYDGAWRAHWATSLTSQE